MTATRGVDSNFGHGYLFFATSDTTDPTGNWTGSYFFAEDFLIDYTRARHIDRQVRVREQLLRHERGRIVPVAGTFDGADVMAIDWADWLDSNPDFNIDGFSSRRLELLAARRGPVPGHEQPPACRHGAATPDPDALTSSTSA